VVATTINPEDDPIIALCQELDVPTFRGSEDDVLERVVLASRFHHIDIIIETTADCPLIDPETCDLVVNKFLNGGYDYVSNVLTRSFPRGMDVQVFPQKILEEVHQITTNPVDREHVSYYIYQHPEKYRLGNILAPPDTTMPELRLTVDTSEDFELVKQIFENLYPQKHDFNLSDILNFLRDHPALFKLNEHIEQKKVSY
jgi:spore coat polysaccharide biosynthesis protein SpsF